MNLKRKNIKFCPLLGDPGSSNGFQILCMIFLFKRGIIARDDLIHALYVIPVKDFQEVCIYIYMCSLNLPTVNLSYVNSKI